MRRRRRPTTPRARCYMISNDNGCSGAIHDVQVQYMISNGWDMQCASLSSLVDNHYLSLCNQVVRIDDK